MSRRRSNGHVAVPTSPGPGAPTSCLLCGAAPLDPLEPLGEMRCAHCAALHGELTSGAGAHWALPVSVVEVVSIADRLVLRLADGSEGLRAGSKAYRFRIQ